MTSAWAAAEPAFKEALGTLTSSAGRFNPDLLGRLTVTTDKARAETHLLRDIAEIVPRGGGRTVSILAHEERHVKAILSAVQASDDFNQQPQRDEDNPLELLLRVEAESADEIRARVAALCHERRTAVRASRDKREKVMDGWVKSKEVTKDVRIKASQKLLVLQRTKLAEIDKIEEATLKKLQAKGK